MKAAVVETIAVGAMKVALCWYALQIIRRMDIIITTTMKAPTRENMTDTPTASREKNT